MTYIIGETFTVTRNEPRPGITSSSQKLKPTQNKLPPGTYSIHHIKRNMDGTMEYTFCDLNEWYINVTFRSVEDADNFIAGIKNQKIPDYNSVYKNLS